MLSVSASANARRLFRLRRCVVGRFGAAFPHASNPRPNHALNRTRQTRAFFVRRRWRPVCLVVRRLCGRLLR
jgi:hypothetical protein